MGNGVRLDLWARQHGVGADALAALRQVLRMGIEQPTHAPAAFLTSESAVLSTVRIEASNKNILLFRNNVGVLKDDTGRPVRYGLGNESSQANAAFKSADLIGVRPVLITPQMVGVTIGQIVSRECKRPGWRYGGNAREHAQLRWAEMIVSYGGDAAFCTGEGTL